MGSQCVEPVLDVLVAAVYLLDIVDAADALGTEGGDEQGYAGTDVGTGHASATELQLAVVTHDDGTVGVAENDLRTHIDELVDEEQAALEHLLVEEHRPACLGGNGDEHAEQVGGESGTNR